MNNIQNLQESEKTEKKFALRLPTYLYQMVQNVADTKHRSMNSWIAEVIEEQAKKELQKAGKVAQ